MHNHWLFSSDNIHFCKCQKASWEKKSKEDKQNLTELTSDRISLSLFAIKMSVNYKPILKELRQNPIEDWAISGFSGQKSVPE